MVISILNIFFTPQFVITFSIAIMFIALVLHLQFVPFKRKWHNLMEYIMLMATILTLFFGLLFLGSDALFPALKTFVEVLSVTVIIVSNVLVIIMTIWDIYVRQKNIGKRKKKERHLNEKNKVTEKLEDEEDYEFHFNWSKWNISSDEDSSLNMNEIIVDLFSFNRLKKKLFLINRKGKRVATKVGQVKNIIPLQSGSEPTVTDEFLQLRAHKMKNILHDISKEEENPSTVKRLSMDSDSDKRLSVSSQGDRFSKEYDSINLLSPKKKSPMDEIISPRENKISNKK
jgi:membrane protein implicated in regulation of membrane protease activity